MNAAEYREKVYGAKYHNKKVVDGDLTFDSKKEYARWKELQLLQKAGEIRDLKRQEKFCLIPALSGGNGKAAQRAVNYIADFVYWEPEGLHWRQVIEDVKGMKTDVYRLKKKLMRWRYGIEIREV